ncbi:MAG TPA: hypothetical protein VMT66_05640 [Steroidobacteraceae bacterium]|nr:hypothetical protein [Steroidobacteraceae bacterium]
MPALLYGFFACYAVTGKCDLRVDSKGRDMEVFASLEECQRFGSDSARQPPDKQGQWRLDEGHYYTCLALTPVPAAAPAANAPSRPVYKTTAEALQRDFQANPDALTRKIGDAVIEVTGTVDSAAIAEGTALQLSGDSWDVTAWLSPEGVAAARGVTPHARITLRCDGIGTLVAGSGRRPAVAELRDCKPTGPQG